MLYSDILDIVDALIEQTAIIANDMAAQTPGFDAIGAGHGVAVRLQALEDVKAAIITVGLRDHEVIK